jgi:hypothetical protein
MAMIRAPNEEIPRVPSVANGKNPQTSIYDIFRMNSWSDYGHELLAHEVYSSRIHNYAKLRKIK